MSTRLNSPDMDGTVHWVTLNVRDHRQAFRRTEYARLALERLRSEADRHPAQLVAYVAMPEHLHFLLLPEDGQLSRFLARFKPGLTLAFDDMARENNHQRISQWLWEKGKRELWQDSKYSLPLWTPEWIAEKIDYIHWNPVERGLVAAPEEYLWSSYGAYCPESGHLPPVAVDFCE